MYPVLTNLLQETNSYIIFKCNIYPTLISLLNYVCLYWIPLFDFFLNHTNIVNSWCQNLKKINEFFIFYENKKIVTLLIVYASSINIQIKVVRLYIQNSSKTSHPLTSMMWCGWFFNIHVVGDWNLIYLILMNIIRKYEYCFILKFII